MEIFFVILGLTLLFLGVLLLRAAFFRPNPHPFRQGKSVSFDQNRVICSLQELVRCKTVSCPEPSMEDEEEFERLLQLLPRLYPLVFQTCKVQRFPERGLLLRWEGTRQDAPCVMMAHYDVVPADADLWDKPPFAGLIEDGVLWGRGTLDTKVTLNGIFSAAQQLMAQGFCPENDLYFAFSGSEEINGKAAAYMVDYFLDQGITPALVLDEGGAVVQNVFPGVKVPCGLIGIAEKGMMNVEYSVRSGGGHASAPPIQTPVKTLSQVCLRVLKHPFKMRINQPAAELFDTLGRQSTFLYKIIFANLRCFAPVLDVLCRFKGGELNALVRTTTAFTQMEGSNARNVLPTQACLVCNMRLSPGDTVASAEKYLKKLVAKTPVEVRVLESFDPSPISVTDCDAYRTVAAVVAQTWPGCIVSPYLMVQCSDARHYGRLSDRVYRFSPLELTAEERKTIHGNNERIPLDAVCKAVEFYIRLMKMC